VNTLHKQSPTTDKGYSTRFGAGNGANIHHSPQQVIMFEESAPNDADSLGIPK
jgi:hypothetical protein